MEDGQQKTITISNQVLMELIQSELPQMIHSGKTMDGAHKLESLSLSELDKRKLEIIDYSLHIQLLK